MHRNVKKFVTYFLTIFFVIAGIISLSDCNLQVRARESDFECQINDSETYINPLYQDVLSEEDLISSDTEGGIATYAEPEYETDDKVVIQTIQEAMIDRENTIMVYYASEQEYDQTRLKNWFEQALEETVDPHAGDYLRWSYGGYKADISHYTQSGVCYCTYTITMTYYTTIEQEKEFDEALVDVITELGVGDPDVSDYDKVKKIYDYICSNVTYDNKNLNDSSYLLKFTAYAALVNKTAVCQGYSALLYRMLEEAGVDTRMIPGNEEEVAHAWNLVNLGSRYYYVDSTWDAGRTNYRYFLKGTNDFSGHVPSSTMCSFLNSYPVSDSAYTVTGISLNKSSLDLTQGDSETLTVSIQPDGAGTGEVIDWSSGNENVATVDASGMVTAISEGSATITVKAAGRMAVCEVSVAEAEYEQPSTPVITSATPSSTKIPYAYGAVEVTVAGTDLSADNLEVSATRDAVCGKPSGIATEQRFTVNFPNNTGITALYYRIYVNVKGQTDKKEIRVTVNGVNVISAEGALKNPTSILDVRDQETISLTGSILGSKFCPQFPLNDASLDTKMQQFAEIYKNNTDPIYILCKTGLGGAPKATRNLLAAGIDPARIFTIPGGADDTDISAAFINAKTGWQKNSTGWWYKNEDGSYPYSCWKLIDDEWYYFNNSGYRVTGWKSIRGKWYYFAPDTGIMQTGWICPGNNHYYLTASGAMATGWLKLDGSWYYLKPSGGAMVTGWVHIGSSWYYLNPADGVMFADKWLDNTYYLKSNGAMATRWLKIGEDWYYYYSNGRAAKNCWIGNYYLQSDGSMATSKWVDGEKYYVDANGAWVPGMKK